MLPALHLPPDVDPAMRHSRLTTSERHRIAELIIRRAGAHSGALPDQQGLVCGLGILRGRTGAHSALPIAEMVANRPLPERRTDPDHGPVHRLRLHRHHHGPRVPHAEVDAISTSASMPSTWPSATSTITGWSSRLSHSLRSVPGSAGR